MALWQLSPVFLPRISFSSLKTDEAAPVSSRLHFQEQKSLLVTSGQCKSTRVAANGDFFLEATGAHLRGIYHLLARTRSLLSTRYLLSRAAAANNGDTDFLKSQTLVFFA